MKRENRHQFVWPVLLFSLVLMIGIVEAPANGWRNPPEGAASLGKTGAKFALTDDPTAMTHNPANVVNVGPFTVLTSLVVINSETEFVGPRGRKGKTKDGWKYLGSGYAGAASEDGRLGYGVAITTPYGQSTQWSDDGPFAFVAPQFAQIRMIAVSPTVASKLSDWVDIGFGVNIYRSDISLRQLYAWSQLTGDPRTPPGNAILKADGSSVGATVGMTLHVADNQRVALTYRSESTVTYEGDAEFKNFPANLPSPVNQIASPSSRFATEITFPNIVGFGYGIEVGEGLKFGVDVEWIEFSSFETLPLDVGSNQPLLPFSGIPQNWDDTWTFGCGADWAVSDTVNLRAGYVYLESPVPSETLAPTLPDTDRHLLSVGFGMRKDRHQIDVAYAISFYDDPTIANNVNPAFDGTYETETHLLQLSYAHTF